MFSARRWMVIGMTMRLHAAMCYARCTDHGLPLISKSGWKHLPDVLGGTDSVKIIGASALCLSVAYLDWPWTGGFVIVSLCSFLFFSLVSLLHLFNSFLLGDDVTHGRGQQ
jgi:hypothetical protein